jgi:hypothetical protein
VLPFDITRNPDTAAGKIHSAGPDAAGLGSDLTIAARPQVFGKFSSTPTPSGS